MKRFRTISLVMLAAICSQLATVSCTTVDLYERTASIPGHSWKNTFKPSFTFSIKDTSSAYDIYLILRHNDKYSFKNIYINLSIKQPGQDTASVQRHDLELATDNEGWLASGMDDIYEHRIRLTPKEPPFYFPRPGEYTFEVEQIMRENPLDNVLNVGLRIEKK